MVNARALRIALLLLLSVPFGAEAAVPAGFSDQLVLDNLDQPTSFDFLPDGRILFTEKLTGNVRIVAGGLLSATPLLTLTDLNNVGNERGLLGIAVDPGWPDRPYVYLYYTRLPQGTIVISRYSATGDLEDGISANLALTDRYDLLNDIPDVYSNHNAGTLRFGPDGMLYASVGEDGVACTAQDSTDVRGSILRMTVAALPDTGSGPPPKSLLTPADNPFPPTDPELGLVYCYGLRNPFRFHVDPMGGHLFIGDVGWHDYEELDEASGGENFGWPLREGPIVLLPGDCPEPGGPGTRDYDDPIAYYDRTSLGSASIIGGPRYWTVSGGAYSFPPEYNGAVFYAEFYSGFVRVIRRVGDVWSPLGPVPGQPNPSDWASGISYIVDMRVGPDGAIYYARLFPGSLRRWVHAGAQVGVGDLVVGPSRGIVVRPNPVRGGRAPVLVLSGVPEAPVRVSIVDVAGRVIRNFMEHSYEEGARVPWDGRDDRGAAVPAGVYYVTASGGGWRASTKLILVP